MKSIYQSATKVVLLLFSLATAIALFTGAISEETFKTATLMVLTYYFTKAQTVKEAEIESGIIKTDKTEIEDIIKYLQKK